MELTHLLVVHLLVGLSARALPPVRADAGEAEATEEAITEEQRKVHEECRNPDYKKYVKCLMRPKRHHHAGHVDGIPETDAAHCLETCFKKCEHQLEHDCEKKCSYCTKRTRHRHQIITEYETECVSGNCNQAGDALRTTNITTNIGIHNYINTFGNRTIGGKDCDKGDGKDCKGKNGKGGENGKGCPGRDGDGDGKGDCKKDGGEGGGGKDGNGNGEGGGEGGGEDGGELTKLKPPEYPSLPIVPQISLVPQITYAYIGFGAAGGCAYSQWLCIQQGGTQVAQHKPDCSICGNPLFRYRCDVSCYATHANATQSG